MRASICTADAILFKFVFGQRVAWSPLAYGAFLGIRQAYEVIMSRVHATARVHVSMRVLTTAPDPVE